MPKEKQFLITKNVPCSKRCSHLVVKEQLEKVIEVESGDGGWVDTHFYEAKDDAQTGNSLNQVHEIIDEKSLKDQQILNEQSLNTQKNLDNEDDEDEDDDDDEPIDMDSYDHNVIDDDDTTVIKPITKTVIDKENNTESKLEDDAEDRFIPTRTYDLNITYDNYYRTPRFSHKI